MTSRVRHCSISHLVNVISSTTKGLTDNVAVVARADGVERGAPGNLVNGA